MDTRVEEITSSVETAAIKRALGETITRYRHSSGIKQRAFSRIVGISNSHLRSIESGTVSPTFVTLYKIAAALDVEPSLLADEACALAHSMLDS